VLAIIPVSGFEDALKQANDVRYGLAAGLVTQDLTEAHEFANRAEAGIVKINEKTTGLELHVPFGGSRTPRARPTGSRATRAWTSTRSAARST